MLTLKTYKPFFEKKCEEQTDCFNNIPCKQCLNGEECLGNLNETCPETSIPSGGKCKKSDNSGYLQGKCDKGYIWDKNKNTCERMSK